MRDLQRDYLADLRQTVVQMREHGRGLTSNFKSAFPALLFLALLFKGPVEDKHMVDLRLNSLYWYFVVLAWVVFYCIFFLDPGLLQVR